MAHTACHIGALQVGMPHIAWPADVNADADLRSTLCRLMLSTLSSKVYQQTKVEVCPLLADGLALREISGQRPECATTVYFESGSEGVYQRQGYKFVQYNVLWIYGCCK